MKNVPEHPREMTLVLLPLPYGNPVEFEVPATLAANLRQIADTLLAAYRQVRSEIRETPPPEDLTSQIADVQQRLLRLLPDLGDHEETDIIYIYIMSWFSQSVDSAGPAPAATLSHFRMPEEYPLRISTYISHVLAWIIVWETHRADGRAMPEYPYTEFRSEPQFKQKKLFVPNAFQNGMALVPNNPVIAAGLRAIFKGGPKARTLLGGWSQIGRRVLYRQFHRSGRGEIRYYPEFPTSGQNSVESAETLWDFVEQINPFTADVALAILAQLCDPSAGNRPKFPLRQSVLINSDAILRYKGIQKYGKDRRVMEKRIHDEMERLRTLHFDLQRYPVPWNKKGFKYQGDRLFDIVKVETYQLQIFDKEEIIETAWSVRAGQWAEHFFNTEQERVWTSRMAKAPIEMDHRNQRKTAQVAKKIGYLLLTVPGGTAHLNHPVMRRIDRILEEIGELPAPEHRTKDWAGRMRDTLMKAWETLLDAGLIKNLKFPDGFGFGDTDRTKGWVADWLCSKVVILTPEAVPEPHRSPSGTNVKAPQAQLGKYRRRMTRQIRKKPANLQLQVGTPAFRKRIRNACQERYITQKSLARILSVAPSTLSNILRGHDLPSLELAEKLHKWLDETS